MEIVNARHSHESAENAVELVTAGRAEALMKGSLHTDELMGAVVSREAGIRTARRISHCFIMDVPNQPNALIITDAAVKHRTDARRESGYRSERHRSRARARISRSPGGHFERWRR
jgi:phosphotransacetylase